MNIRWTPLAADDLEQHARFAETQAEGRGRETAWRIYRSVQTLRTFPRLGRSGMVADTREYVVPGLPFLIVYQITTNDTVCILRILHTSMRRE